jgi:hypothetical protein
MKLRYISIKRDNEGLFQGLIVRVPLTKTKYFSIKKYKTFKKTTDIALQYRNEKYKEFYSKPDYTGCLLQKKNTSGIIGVAKVKNQWVATSGREFITSFSVNIYGEEEAFKRAVKARFNVTSKGGFTKPDYIHLG